MLNGIELIKLDRNYADNTKKKHDIELFNSGYYTMWSSILNSKLSTCDLDISFFLL